METKSLNFGKDTTIFCDMDGVLVDFAGAAIDKLNKILEAGETYHLFSYSKTARKAYSKIIQELGKDWRASKESDLEIKSVKNLLMSVISRNPGKWFQELDPLEDGIGELWPLLNSMGRKVCLLTAGIPGRESAITAEDGKKAWAKKYLTPAPSQIIVTKAIEKVNEAINSDGTANILIDDKKKTIDAWNEAGGFGILHQPGNSQRSIKELNRIKDLLLVKKEASLLVRTNLINKYYRLIKA